MEGAVKPWKGLPRAVGESPSLGMYRKSVDVPLGDMVRDDQGDAVLMVGLSHL